MTAAASAEPAALRALASLREQVLAAATAVTPLRIRGGGSKDFYGQKLDGVLLDTRGYSGVVAYEPTELVLTARCGTPLAEVENLLARHNQMLAFEPPHFGDGATFGGCIAAGLSGPRRAAAGALRDFVLGVKLLDGRGEVLEFGGQVMKNVAGYDVARVLAGSLGVLGVLLETSVKVLPRPAASATLVFEHNAQQALDQVNAWAGQPVPISASIWHAGQLHVRLCGARAAVATARERLGGQVLPAEAADAFWLAIREQRHGFFEAGLPLWRLSVKSTDPLVELPGDQLIEWGGALRWMTTDAPAQVVRAAATSGHATLFRATPEQRAGDGVFQPLAPGVAQIHRLLKSKFDPAGIFNRGRLYADF